MKLLIPFPPGGSNDVVGRYIASEFGRFIAAEMAKWARVVRDAGIKAE